MKTYKTYIECCRAYTSKMRSYNRKLKLLIIIATVIGAACFFLNKWFAFFSTIIAFLGEITPKILPQLIQPEEELAKLDNIASRFEEILMKMESLWNKYENEKFTDEEADELLIRYKAGNAVYIDEMNRLVRKISDKDNGIVQTRTEEYFQRKFYPNE